VPAAPTPPEDNSQDVTELIGAWRRGDPAALEGLLPLVYEDLRRRAHACLRQERSGHTLQTTDLVHEAYLKLAGGDKANLGTRGQFLAIAAHLMRQILVDYARARNAVKRGAGAPVLSLVDSIRAAGPDSVDVIALDAALDRLTALDERQATVVELRYFAGLSIEETSAAMNISSALVKQEWRLARAWLYSELSTQQGYDSGTMADG